MKKTIVIIALVIALPIAYWLISPLFIDKEVNEDLPFSVDRSLFDAVNPDGEPNIVLPPPPKEDNMDAIDGLAQQVKEEQREDFMKEMMAIVDVPAVDAEMPTVRGENDIQPSILSVGQFSDVAHHGSGIAKIIQLGGGTGAILRLENLDVLNGPDLRVLLSDREIVHEGEDLGDYVELGKLKGNKGNQNYAISDDIDLSKYQSVVIYCKPFHVVFNAATLGPAK